MKFGPTGGTAIFSANIGNMADVCAAVPVEPNLINPADLDEVI